MNNNFYNSIVARTNQDYLESMQKTINQLVGCMVEKMVYTALYGTDYLLYKPITDNEIKNVIKDVEDLIVIAKYNILSIILNISNLSMNNKIDLFVDISTVTIKDDSGTPCSYLRVEFPFKHNLLNLNFSCINLDPGMKNIIDDIFDKMIQICFCHNKEYHLDNNKNRLYTFIKPNEILLIGNNEVKNIVHADLISKVINTEDSELDLSLVLNPLLECLESNYDKLSLNLFNIK